MHSHTTKKGLLGLALLLAVLRSAISFCWSPTTSNDRQRIANGIVSQTRLFGKGFRGIKNKQAALAEKMKLAKKQQSNEEVDTSDGTGVASIKPADRENDSNFTQSENDAPKGDSAHAEFAKLLANSKPPRKSSSSAVAMKPKFGPVAPGSNMAKFSKHKRTKSKTSDEIRHQQKPSTAEHEPEMDDTLPLHHGDKARRRDFEFLVDVTTSKALGPVRAASLAPWVPPFVVDYLVILADPRPQSSEWRRAVEYAHSTFNTKPTKSKQDRLHFMAITTEPTKETTAWMARSNVPQEMNSGSFCIVQDMSDWMTSYGCMDSPDGWSLHVLVIDNDGIIQVHQGGVDPSRVCSIISTSLASSDAAISNKQGKR